MRLYSRLAYLRILHSHILCPSSLNLPSLLHTGPAATTCVTVMHQRCISTSVTTSRGNFLVDQLSVDNVYPVTLLLPPECWTGTGHVYASLLCFQSPQITASISYCNEPSHQPIIFLPGGNQAQVMYHHHKLECVQLLPDPFQPTGGNHVPIFVVR